MTGATEEDEEGEADEEGPMAATRVARGPVDLNLTWRALRQAACTRRSGIRSAQGSVA